MRLLVPALSYARSGVLPDAIPGMTSDALTLSKGDFVDQCGCVGETTRDSACSVPPWFCMVACTL
jgi:hypothetical protein